MGPNPAAQVRFVNFLSSVTAPGVFHHEFALLEMIAELSNSHRAGIRYSAISVDLQDQPHYRAPCGILIRVSLDCADDLLVVKTLAVRAAYRPPKLPDFGTSLAFESLHTTMLHVSSCTAVAEQKIQHLTWGRGEISRVNCFAAAMFFCRNRGL